MRIARAPFLVALLVIAAGEPAFAGPGRPAATMDRQIQQAHDEGRSSRVIIRYRAGAGPSLKKRMQTRGNQVIRNNRGVGALSASLNAGELRTWAKDPDILGISADARISAHGFFNSTTSYSNTVADAQHLRRTLGLPATYSGGAGIGVAVIDSGIAPMPDIAARITAFYDFTAGGVAAYPSDAYGHGTHVAGLIAGNGLMSGGRYVGLAPDVRLIGLKVLDANGQGYASDLLNALEFAIDNRVALGIDVINLSLGHPVLEPSANDPLVQAVERASAAGIIVVASAGNMGKKAGATDSGFGGITSPGDAPSAITVGSLRSKDTERRDDDTVSGFSSRGPTWYDGLLKPDVLAPGEDLVAISNPLSTLYARPNLRADVPSYLRLSGTSMATAVTSGVVALVLEAQHGTTTLQPRLTPNAVKALLQYSAVPVARHNQDVPAALEQGAGGLNAAGAVALVEAIQSGTQPGAWWLDTSVTAVTLIGSEDVEWSRLITWGDRLVWGESIARRQSAWDRTWGDPVTWGPEVFVDPTSLVVESFGTWSGQTVRDLGQVTTSSNHIVWGDSFDEDHVVWGNSFDDDDHIVWGNSFEEPVVTTVPSSPEMR